MSQSSPNPAAAALARLRILALGGNLEACCQLGRCLTKGWGAPVDASAALRWYLRAARAGHAEAAFRAASLALRNAGLDVPPDLLPLVEEAAYVGHVETQALLGWCHQRGRLGARVDLDLANRWLRQAALAGSPNGRYLFALNLAAGRGLEPDQRAAVALLELAAEQGDVRAQLDLGRALCEGRGVARDPAAALAWYRAAARRGYAKAQFNLGLLLAGGAGPEQDDEQAACWIRAAAEQGLGKAQYTLATLYRRGLGVPQNDDLARRWLTRAAAAGHPRAQYRLSRTLRAAGEPAEALRWLEAAACGGLPAAQLHLARHFVTAGDDLACARAVGWFRRAAEAGEARAMHGLGVCCYKGIGLRRDLPEALYWFRRAAAAGSRAASHALERLERRLGPADLARARRTARRQAP